MIQLDRKAPVLVTGATGYVAGWLVKRLLDEGMTVHAAVRDPSDENKIGHLKELADNSAGSIKFFKADLTEEGSYSEAMEGCELIFHTASPFILHPKNPQKDVVEPALNGTRNVLNQASKATAAKRVVLTSSVAAIYGDNIDMKKTSGNRLSEANWNETSNLSHHPYSYSKTLAEKEAWKIYENQNKWDMVVINPSFVIGPGISPNGTSESFSVIKQMGDGTMKSGIPNWQMAMVDVRDLAEAHYLAGFKPEATGRYIISGYDASIMDMADALREKYGSGYPLPKKIIPKPLIWLFGPIMNPLLSRKVIARNVNYPLVIDNSKGKRELGIKYRPFEESVTDFFQQMIDNDMFNKKR